MILGGDIGGTKTNLALFEPTPAGPKKRISDSYSSRDYPSLEAIIDRFFSVHPTRAHDACFGVAGPVQDGRAAVTNLAWVVDSKFLARKLKIARVGLLNDLEASAWGIGGLQSKDFLALHQVDHRTVGNAAVISAGTGLGEAGLYWDGQRYHPFPSEGGHSSFAPQNDLEIELARYLASRFGHVSTERVLSGPGLYNIYQFLKDTDRGEEPPWFKQELQEHDPAATISRFALEKRS